MSCVTWCSGELLPVQKLKTQFKFQQLLAADLKTIKKGKLEMFEVILLHVFAKIKAN